MITPKEIYGPWVSIGTTRATRPEDKQRVYVAPTKYSPTDIAVMVGCQQGILHVTTALATGMLLIEAALEIAPDLAVAPILVITGPDNREYTFSNVHEIRSVDHMWTAFGKTGEVITGAHRADAFRFRFREDEVTKKAIALIAKIKEVKETEPETREPEPTP